MTDEQIKQNAYHYLDNLDRSGIILTGNEVYNAYVAGAHSRDREAMDLEHLLKAEITTNKVLVEVNDKLRNQWINVEDRLPAKNELVLVKTGRGNFYLAEKDSVAQSRDEFAIPQLSCYVNGVTQWMPISELQKGE